MRRWSLSRRRLLAGVVAGGAVLGFGAEALRTGRGSTNASRSDLERALPESGTSTPGPRGQTSLRDLEIRPTSALLVREENARPGTTAWRITDYAGGGEIQGYANRASVNVGDSLSFFVSTRRPGTNYRIDFYRMGWYSGAGARLISSVTDLPGRSQGFYTGSTGLVGCGACRTEANTGLLDAHWEPSYRLDVPRAWLSGVYLALLTDARGKQTYAPFVVRDDERASALLFKTSFNTYQAYNAWGGKSLYADNSFGAKTVGGGPGAVKVSFNRPFDADFGSGEFLRYEYNLLRWMERQGYDVSYVADGDLGTNAELLLQHRGFVSAGHDEYWSAAERRNVEQALAHGVHLAFLSGDAVYWQARSEASATGDPNRTLVVYRGAMDPLHATDPTHATVRWQDPPVNRPQHMLTGTLYAGQTDPFTQDWVTGETSSWIFGGTGLKSGDRIKGLVGKEFDRSPVGLTGPKGLQILSHSPITVTEDDRPPPIAFAESTIYTAPSGASVFSAGTVTWGWGLDDSSFPIGALHNTPVSLPAQRLTQNLLDLFSSGLSAPQQ